MKNIETPLLRVEYITHFRVVTILLRVCWIWIFAMFFVVFDNYFAYGFAIFAILYLVWDIFNIQFFDELIFYDDRIVKKSTAFGKITKRVLLYSDMAEAMLSKGTFGGTLSFSNKAGGINGIKTAFTFWFDIMPITKDTLIQIKEILLSKQLISERAKDMEWGL